jgi:hypothetical protein
LLLHVLVRRFVPKTPDWLLVIASIGLALSSVVPFILRRPAVYEVAISAGYCFSMAGLLLITQGTLATEPKRRKLALGSLCLGLAIGARVTLVPLGFVAVGTAVYLIRRRQASWRILVPLLGPLAACALLLGAYNAVRFGSPAELGQRFALAGVDQTKLPYDQLSFVPPGAFSYLFLPPRVALTFPHVFLMDNKSYPFPLPRLYAGTPHGTPPEPASGLLPTAPITLLLLLIPVLWRRWDPGGRRVLLVASALTFLGLMIVAGLSWGLFGSTERYEVDYTTLFLIAAFLVWTGLLGRAEGVKRLRRGIAVTGVALTMAGAAAGMALSLTGYSDLLELRHPSTFEALENLTSPFATLAVMVRGKAAIARVDDPPEPNGVGTILRPKPGYGTVTETFSSGWLGGTRPMTVTVVSPGAERPWLRVVAVLGPDAGTRASVNVRVQSPGHTVTVPVRHAIMSLPIRLHLGLNRIRLRLDDPTLSGPLVVWLASLELVYH